MLMRGSITQHQMEFVGVDDYDDDDDYVDDDDDVNDDNDDD